MTDATPSERDTSYQWPDLLAAEGRHFWFRARRELVLWSLARYFPAARTVLEVGCGTGFVLEGMRRQAPHLLLAGCDALPGAIRCARERLDGVPLFQADARHLPLGQPFDAIAALDVLEHIDEDDGALAEMYRALRPGGGLLVTVPQHQWLWSAIDDFSGHRRRYSRPDLLVKARVAGFEILRCTSFFSSTLPFVAASRLLTRRGRRVDPVAELRIPRVVNTALRALIAPEWLLIRAGVSLPIGGSLMLVARRPLA